jgi:hypothetical protein
MELQKILSLIPSKLLEELAIETEVNVFTKKLQGEVIFKLLLHCILSHKDNSLRTMESAYESLFFKLINQKHHKGSITYSSISTRLSAINPVYFEKIFETCVQLYNKQLGKERENIIRFDSTIVSLTTKLLNVGYHIKGGDADKVRQLKFTIGFANNIPSIAHFYNKQNYTSENVALRETILIQAEEEKESIKIFDRGITARKTYDELTSKNIEFISRLNTNAKYKVVQAQNSKQKIPIETPSIIIVSDDWCQLYSSDAKSKFLIRRIEAVIKESNETIVFITNNKTLAATEITVLYKRRWDIEVFFKFIKHTLNFKHLLNRSENGIKVVLYATMTASILLLAYKKENHLSGYKIPKQKFNNELEIEITKGIITLCGGNPNRLNEILLCNSS